jgi:hypothetical protein
MARNEADNQSSIYFFTPEYMDNCRLFGELLRKTKTIDGSVDELPIVSPQREISDSESSDEDFDHDYGGGDEYWGDGETACRRRSHRAQQQELVSTSVGKEALPSAATCGVEETFHMTTASLETAGVHQVATKARSKSKKKQLARARSEAQRAEAVDPARAKAPSTAKKKLGGPSAQGPSAASSSTLNPLTKEAVGRTKKQQYLAADKSSTLYDSAVDHTTIGLSASSPLQEYPICVTANCNSQVCTGPQQQLIAGQEGTDHGAPTTQLSKSIARHQGIPRGAPIGIQTPIIFVNRETEQFKLYQGCDLGAKGDKPSLSTFYALQSTSAKLATAASRPTLSPLTKETSGWTEVAKATKAERSKGTRGGSVDNAKKDGTRQRGARGGGRQEGERQRAVAPSPTLPTECVQQSRVNVTSISNAISTVNVRAASAQVHVISVKHLDMCMHDKNKMKHVASTK